MAQLKTCVITGMGCLTPLGADLASTWQALLAGTSGITALTEPWAEEFAARICGRAAIDPAEKLDRVKARKMDRTAQFAVLATQEAWTDSGLDAADIDPEKLAVSIGTGIGGLHSLLANWDMLSDRGPRRVSPLAVPMLMANAAAANVGLQIGAKAGVHCPVSACASGNEAVAQGLNLIRLGQAEVVVAGGAEAAINPLPLAAFANMQALSRRNDAPQLASRPWDQDRDGFVLSEGAAVLVLESLDHALARKARIYATIAGAGISADSHDMVQPDPSGAGQASAMRKALRDADLAAGQINHVNAHATSTPQGDRTEAKSVREVLGGDTDRCLVTGTKSMTGHLLGAAGAVETIFTAMALANRIVPPTINLDRPDEGLEINIAANHSCELPSGDLAALNNSFGFGGSNVAIALTNANTTVG